MLKEVYDEVYSGLDYGPVCTARGLNLAVHLAQWLHPQKILCVGSGNAYEAVWFMKKGWDTYTLDYHCPDVKILEGRQFQGAAQRIPFPDDSFHTLFSAEMLEHIPEDEIDQVLNEFRRVAKYFYFTIDDEEDPPFNTHICIHGIGWWIDKLEGIGFKIQTAQHKPRYVIKHDIGANNSVERVVDYDRGMLFHATRH